MSPASAPRFDAVVFAGGGCRCFWQAGFWTAAAPALALEPRAVAAVSAGAAFACAAIGGALEDVLEAFVRRTTANERNVYPSNVVRGRPAFPHEPMYRGTILETMTGRVLEQLQSGPEVRVLLASPPRRIPVGPAVLVGYAAYGLERLWGGGVHSTLSRRLGFRPRVVSAQSCASPEELADLILHSSCMPPLTPVYRRDDGPVIDGAILDSAPADLVDEFDQTLVLLTRRYERLPSHPRRVYVQPSRPLPIVMWDYASPDRVRETYALGLEDGRAFVDGLVQPSSRRPTA